MLVQAAAQVSVGDVLPQLLHMNDAAMLQRLQQAWLDCDDAYPVPYPQLLCVRQSGDSSVALSLRQLLERANRVRLQFCAFRRTIPSHPW